MPNPAGVQNVLANGVDDRHPFSFAETPSGLLLMANGIDPMLKWDGLAAFADTVGIAPPPSEIQLGGSGVGHITGRLLAWVRFYDALGNTSDLSPVSNVLFAGRDGLIDRVTFDPASGVVTVLSQSHGLGTGATLLIEGVQGVPLANGQRTIAVVDENLFTLDGLVNATGAYTQGGVWTVGVQSLTYDDVPLPSDTKVVGRQILRNLDGNLVTLYVDIDTADLTSTSFSSQTLDSTLLAGVPVPLFYRVAAPPAPDGELPFASRHGLPPTHKSVIEPHKGRVFAAVDSVYTDGHAEVEFNSSVVQGVGTGWRSTFAGRLFHFDGAVAAYQIASVDETAQQITLTRPFLDPPKPFGVYSIQPDPAERRLLYFSEPELPESWPAYNAVSIPEDNDTLSGMVSLGQYLYLIERRHIYRMTFQADPSDGMVFLCSQRGSLSNRTYCVTDVGVLCLDEIGIHKFDAGTGESHPISMPIQSVFHGDGTSDLQIDWAADQSLWHASHDPVRDTVRWFVAMIDYEKMNWAICYNYRTDRFWMEEYPTSVTASCPATIGARRALVGTEGRRILCLSEGGYDGIDGTGTIFGSVSAADTVSLNDTAATFADLEGAVISVIHAADRTREQRLIAFNSPTSIAVVEPWDETPAFGDFYQVGVIAWAWRSGWFRYINTEEESPRDVEVVFKPVVNPATMHIQLFYDHSLTPTAWSRDIEQDGVKTVAGDPRIAIQMDTDRGWARQRMSSHGTDYGYQDEYVSVAMTGVQAGEPIRISQLVIGGVEQ